MKNTTKRTFFVVLLVVLFFLMLGYMLFSFIAYGSAWVTHKANTHVFSSGEITVAGTVYDRNGIALVSTEDGERVYNEDLNIRRSTFHAVGDSAGYIATGTQTLYRSNLLGYNLLNGIYPILSSGKGSNVTLTLDANVCKAAYEAMNGKKGTVAVYNYKTGEIVCMVSAPTYDPENKPSDAEINSPAYNGVYLNRALSGVFTPGSTFKVVTAIAAIENIPDLFTRSFYCGGKISTGDGGEVRCNGVHYTMSFERALNVSCNCVFAELAIELGPEILTQTVRDMGFANNITVSKAVTVRSSFDLSDSSPEDIGWAGIGQYTTLVNPTQMLQFMGAIANGGTAVTPYLVESSSDLFEPKGEVNKNVVLSEETANLVAALLRSNVENYYDDSKFPNLEMCGKTGTAEVAKGDPHAWFVGFSQREDFPYAVVVCLENGGWGYYQAIPVANKTMQALLAAEAA